MKFDISMSLAEVYNLIRWWLSEDCHIEGLGWSFERFQDDEENKVRSFSYRGVNGSLCLPYIYDIDLESFLGGATLTIYGRNGTQLRIPVTVD